MERGNAFLEALSRNADRLTPPLQPIKEALTMRKLYWYTFEDGHRYCTGRLSRLELAVEVSHHGRLISKTPA